MIKISKQYGLPAMMKSEKINKTSPIVQSTPLIPTVSSESSSVVGSVLFSRMSILVVRTCRNSYVIGAKLLFKYLLLLQVTTYSKFLLIDFDRFYQVDLVIQFDETKLGKKSGNKLSRKKRRL